MTDETIHANIVAAGPIWKKSSLTRGSLHTIFYEYGCMAVVIPFLAGFVQLKHIIIFMHPLVAWSLAWIFRASSP